ncbi:MAG TPA: MBL fold metallo-hydrolase [Candidatus Acidoferrales bacterium]|nr:MBL fold metallo-hydrolase [Candidatus Acidoferrales bacterium]
MPPGKKPQGDELVAPLRVATVAALLVAASLAAAAPPRPQGPPAVLLSPDSLTRVSDHVYALIGFPNIGIVVGNRATLVVDTGLGARNGAVAAGEARKLAKGPLLYLTTTHFHPEHAAGEGGFPPNTVLIRDEAQQKELAENGRAMVERFSQMSAQNKALLAGVKFRAPDIVFDRELRVDLGGVTARLFWMGTAHTLGDEMIYVEPDKTLLSGDIVQNRMLPNLYGPNARLKSWVEILDRLRPLEPRYVVPDHGALGDGSLVEREYSLLSNLQSRTLELKRQGKSADDAGRILLAEFKTKYPDWPNLNGLPGLVKHVYSENP